MSLNIYTFGCRLNTYESELIRKAAEEAALDNVIIFNGCAVTEEAERQLKQAIRKEKRANPNKKIIVTGCAAQINPKKYLDMEEVDYIIGNNEKTKSESYNISKLDHEKILVNDIMSIKETAEHMFVDKIEGRARAFVQIQNGCNHRCTYCIIPYGRGNSRSVPFGEIVEQTKLLVSNGYKEIVLTGVDITDYGLDLPGKPSFGLIVKRLLMNVPDLFRLRLSSLDVAEVDEHLIQVFAENHKIAPYIHISLQSGDNMILKRMKRRHNREQVIEFCNKMRNIRHDIVFGADIIAGFPTETEEFFQNTYNLIKEAGITFLHVFPYSERDGTPASRMPQVPINIRKERGKILRELGKDMLRIHYEKQVGRVLDVISESKNMSRAPDFSIVHIKTDRVIEPGEVKKVKILGFDNNNLMAEICV